MEQPTVGGAAASSAVWDKQETRAQPRSDGEGVSEEAAHLNSYTGTIFNIFATPSSPTVAIKSS